MEKWCDLRSDRPRRVPGPGAPGPTPAAWLPRTVCTGPTWLVGARGPPLLLTGGGAEGFRHRFSDFSLCDRKAHQQPSVQVC